MWKLFVAAALRESWRFHTPTLHSLVHLLWSHSLPLVVAVQHERISGALSLLHGSPLKNVPVPSPLPASDSWALRKHCHAVPTRKRDYLSCGDHLYHSSASIVKFTISTNDFERYSNHHGTDLYIISCALLAFLILLGYGTAPAIDAFFFGCSANTESGLNTVDVKLLKTGEQLVLYFFPIVTNLAFINIAVVLGMSAAAESML